MRSPVPRKASRSGSLEIAINYNADSSCASMQEELEPGPAGTAKYRSNVRGGAGIVCGAAALQPVMAAVSAY